MFESLGEWSHLPGVVSMYFTSPMLWLWVIMGNIVGFVIGVLPGLGPTMGMALCLGVVFKIPIDAGLALLIGITVGSLCSGGITASLANIPGTSAAAATCVDGFALTKQGRGREAVGISFMASVIGTASAMAIIFLIQPFITSVALKFGDWEVFLFCLFGVAICGSLAGTQVLKGWASGILGIFLAMVGIEPLQSVQRFTFVSSNLLAGLDPVCALLGLFGLAEVLYVMREKKPVEILPNYGFPIIRLSIFKKYFATVVRSVLAGLWIGFIPGIGESVACWFSYDLAKRSSKNKEEFGKGSMEGILAAETANNACSAGALIPSLALGVPGSGLTAIFIAAMFLMNLRPGPTLLLESPGILCKIVVLFWMSAAFSIFINFFLSRFVIIFFSIPRGILMPIIGALCVLGAWGTTNTFWGVVTMSLFGMLGYIMKTRDYPVAPMVLGMLIGGILDISLRRSLIQYAGDLSGLVLRPFGLGIMVLLAFIFYMGVRTTKKQMESN
jgi:putative tricarboxylic transport membrane protein